MPSFSILIQPIVDEAVRRGIRARRVHEMPDSYAILDYRGHRETVAPGLIDRVGAVTLRVLQHRVAPLQALEARGLPVAPARVSATVRETLKALEELEVVAIKPNEHTGGEGVQPLVSTPAEAEAAHAAARRRSPDRLRVVVQRHVEGTDHRLLVVGEHVYGVQRVPAQVVGDGERDVRALVAAHNDRTPVRVRQVRVDEALEQALAHGGWSLDAVPPAGAVVRLGERADTHRGGFCHDVTDLMCHEAVDLARAAAAELGVPFLAVDVISEDIVHSPGRIVEIAAAPSIVPFVWPTSGRSRPVAASLVDLLFPETAR